MDFADRLERRQRVWWTDRRRLGGPRTLRDTVHAWRERRERHSAGDPQEDWVCCDLWPRKLLHKWNGREFAARHAVPVPTLYAYARSVAELPLRSLPDRYVVRPAKGRCKRGVVAMVEGRDLLSGEALSPDAVRARLGKERREMAGPYLVEEFVGGHDGATSLPVEYRCHTFGDRVGAVRVVQRTGGSATQARHRFYSPDWTPFEDAMETGKELAPPTLPPPFLDDLVEAASRLGTTVGTYMRIDFFGTASGLVFSEFSSCPAITRLPYTPFCRDLFGRMWEEAFPGAT